MRKINLENTMCESLYRYDYEIISTLQFATREECATQTPCSRSSETDCGRTAFILCSKQLYLYTKKYKQGQNPTRCTLQSGKRW